MKNFKKLIFYIIFFQLFVNIICQTYVPKGRFLHTATLVGTRIYFLGGALARVGTDPTNRTSEFFYLDVSKPFNNNEPKPYVRLESGLPSHFGAVTSVFGELKDSIFLFGGFKLKDPSGLRSTFSFNTTTEGLKFNIIINTQGIAPADRLIMKAVTDNNNKIYIFGGGFQFNDTTYQYVNEMDIYDTISKIWTRGANATGRDGYTATFLPDTGEIIYIGGINNGGLTDIANLDVYNTVNDSWNKLMTKNPPEPRYGHTAVLTNDKRIVVFGGAQFDVDTPVKINYVVLDIKTNEWYQGKNDPSSDAPFIHHTANLYDDHMFIAFGLLYATGKLSNGILIYKIGDYANFTVITNYPNNEDIKTTMSPTFKGAKNNNNSPGTGVVIGIIIGALGLGFLGFIAFKRYKRYKEPPIIRIE